MQSYLVIGHVCLPVSPFIQALTQLWYVVVYNLTCQQAKLWIIIIIKAVSGYSS